MFYVDSNGVISFAPTMAMNELRHLRARVKVLEQDLNVADASIRGLEEENILLFDTVEKISDLVAGVYTSYGKLIGE